MTVQRSLRFLATLLLVSSPLLAQDTGTISGRLARADGTGVANAIVSVQEAAVATTTETDGTFVLSGLPAGTYTVVFTSGENVESEAGVEVTAGATTTVDKTVAWEISFVETITVFSASRRAERIVDAPAAVTLVTSEEIGREASHGQVPKLLEFTPGAEVTQSGIYDYNFNTRGFNSSLNRRVATLIDGRDPSVPFLGAQEWAAIGFPLDDLANLELVRGPSAALYGANASSGVLNMTTKQPRYSQGGSVRLTGGELSTRNADVRWATELGGDWYLKLLGGYRESGDFTRSRRGQAEYAVPCTQPGQTDCLPQEAVPLTLENDNEISFASVRLDKYMGNGDLLSIEGGRSEIQGPAFQTGIGRVQLVEVDRPWARANYSSERWNLLAYYNGRDAPRQTALASGANLALDTENYQIELQTNWEFADGKVRLVAGGAYGEESIDTFDPTTGRQSLVFAPIDTDSQSLFAQIDWEVGDKVKVVLAGRFDDSTLHDSQFSPKASLVYGINPNNTLRFTYNEAFQVANYSEFFLQAGVAPPVNLAAIEGICLLGGTTCGFAPGPTPILALGNENLELEEVQTFEVGYSGIYGNRTFLTIDYYNSNNENFITDLLPQLGTSLGRINPDFGPYQPPASLGEPFRSILLATLQGALGPSFGILSNNLDGSPIFAAVSYTNFGEVDTQGIDVGINYYFDNDWTFSGSYSWFDFEIQGGGNAFENILLPNSPEHKISLGLGYKQESWDLDFSFRWVDDFRWSVGPFQGEVKRYYTADLGTNIYLNDNWSLGANVANVFDNVHYESFGGDLVGRRALGHVAFSW